MGSALDKRGMLRVIWNNIEDLMIENNFNRKILAKKADVHATILTQIKFRKANPTLGTLEKIAEALGITLGELCNLNHKK